MSIKFFLIHSYFLLTKSYAPQLCYKVKIWRKQFFYQNWQVLEICHVSYCRKIMKRKYFILSWKSCEVITNISLIYGLLERVGIYMWSYLFNVLSILPQQSQDTHFYCQVSYLKLSRKLHHQNFFFRLGSYLFDTF